MKCISVVGSKVFNWIPDSWKLPFYRAAMYVHGRRYKRLRGPVSVISVGSLVGVADRDYSLMLPSFRRIPRYRRGTAWRIELLAKKYGCPAFFEPKPGDVVLDVGANIGEFSIYCAMKGAGVVAFEPDPVVHDCLRRNLARFPQVDVLQMALWDQRTTLRFYSAVDKADSSLIKPETAVGAVVDVETWPLDEVTRIADLPQIDFLKMDGEGAEPEILRGATKILGRVRRTAIDVAPERQGEATKDAVITILDSLGFRILNHGARNVLLAENLHFQES